MIATTTNNSINVKPFFNLLHKHYDDDLNVYAKSLDKEIKLLVEVLPVGVNLTAYKNLLSSFFSRRDMINGMY